MIITISSIKEKTKTSAKGKKYKVVEVVGTKWATEEEWSTAIFKNKTELLAMLEEFAPGDVANFKFDTSGKFPELTTIEEPTRENLAYAEEKVENPQRGGSYQKKTTGGNSNAGGKTTGGSLSKAEWAEKDRLTNIRIAKAVALKAAIDNKKEGTALKTLIKMAEEIVPWLLDTDINGMGSDPEDALDSLEPPVE